jgi:glycine cleavage system aminomethyltransferase T
MTRLYPDTTITGALALASEASGHQGMGQTSSSAHSPSPSITSGYHHAWENCAIIENNDYCIHRVIGDTATITVDRAVLHDVTTLAPGQGRATLLLQPDGRLFALTYVLNEGASYLLISKGARRRPLTALLREQAVGQDEVLDLSAELETVSLHGPHARLLIDAAGVPTPTPSRACFAGVKATLFGSSALVIRLDGLSEGILLTLARQDHDRLMNGLLTLAGEGACGPCLPADLELFRLENRRIDVTREGALAMHVLELGCAGEVDLGKAHYVGKAAVERGLSEGVPMQLIGLVGKRGAAGLQDARAFRPGSRLFLGTDDVGVIANAGYSPRERRWIGVAFVDRRFARPGLVARLDDAIRVRTHVAPRLPWAVEQPRWERPMHAGPLAQHRILNSSNLQRMSLEMVQAKSTTLYLAE